MSAGRGTYRPNMWQRFAGKGGIGKARALCDCVAEDHDSLAFEKGDEIIVLLRIPDREDIYLGSRYGTLGNFAGSNVEFLGPLKKPIKRLRVPTRLGIYTPMQSSLYDSDASSSHFGKLPSADSAFSPTSPGWLVHHSPHLDGRQRSLSASISAASTTDIESSSSLYEDYQRRRSMPGEDVLPHGNVRPWLSAISQSIHSIDSNPGARRSSHPSINDTVSQVSSGTTSPRVSYSDPQQPFTQALSGLGHNETGYSPSCNKSAVRSRATLELTAEPSSFPPSSLPLRPNYVASLHMPKPRVPAPHRPSFLKQSFTSTVTYTSPLRVNGFGDTPLVEDDDDTPPADASAPTITSAPVFTASFPARIISHSPRPASAHDKYPLGSPSPRSPLSPISRNYPIPWSSSPVQVPIFCASPATSPAPHSTHRQSAMSPRNRLASLTRRPRPSSRSGSGSSSCADAENLPPVPPLPHGSARKRPLPVSESAHPGSSSPSLLRETLRAGASPSPSKLFRSADHTVRLSLDTRPPSSARGSSGSGGRNSVRSSAGALMSPSSSDTAPDWLVYASTQTTAELPVPPDEWALPPLAPRQMSRLGFESIPEEGDSLMQVDGGYTSVRRSLDVNPLGYVYGQAAVKRRKDVRVYSSSSSSSNRLSKSDGESSWPSN